jgi:TonB family protein
MNPLLDSTIRISLILLLALGVTSLLRRHSAALRHWMLATALLCAAVMPVLTLVAPSWHVSIDLAPSPKAGDAPETIVGPATTTGGLVSSIVAPARAANETLVERVFHGLRDSRIRDLVVPLWLTGAAMSFGLLVGGMARLAKVHSRSQGLVHGRWRELADEIARKHGPRRPVLLLQSDHPTLLVTWGVARPKIVLPAAARGWADDRIRVVLSHELAHIRRGDWAVQMGAELLRCIYWFNPLLSIACRRLRQQSEYACDDVVLNSGINGTAYATHLLDVARMVATSRHTWSAAVAVAQPSTLERRIRAMLNVQLNRKPVTAASRLAGTLALVAIAVPMAGFGAPAVKAPAGAASDVALASTDVHIGSLEREQTRRLIPTDLVPRNAPVTRFEALSAAQAGSASVTGVLWDQLGLLLPGVTVRLTEQRTGAVRTVTTDGTGRFFVGEMPAGTYVLETELPGFETHRETLALRAGEGVQRNLTLEIGSLEETITVTSEGSGPQVQRAPRPEPGSGGRGNAAPQAGQGRGAGPFTVRVGGNIRTPRKLVSVPPIYPAALAANGTSGHVVLLGRIDVDGFIIDVRLMPDANDPATHPDFVAAAMDAVRQWEFTPTLLNGVPVEVNIRMNITFTAQ